MSINIAARSHPRVEDRRRLSRASGVNGRNCRLSARLRFAFSPHSCFSRSRFRMIAMAQQHSVSSPVSNASGSSSTRPFDISELAISLGMDLPEHQLYRALQRALPSQSQTAQVSPPSRCTGSRLARTRLTHVYRTRLSDRTAHPPRRARRPSAASTPDRSHRPARRQEAVKHNNRLSQSSPAAVACSDGRRAIPD